MIVHFSRGRCVFETFGDLLKDRKYFERLFLKGEKPCLTLQETILSVTFDTFLISIANNLFSIESSSLNVSS